MNNRKEKSCQNKIKIKKKPSVKQAEGCRFNHTPETVKKTSENIVLKLIIKCSHSRTFSTPRELLSTFRLYEST